MSPIINTYAPSFLILVNGTELRHGPLQLKADRDVSLSVTFDGKRARLVSSPPVAFETLDGTPVYTAGRDATVSITNPSPSSPTGFEQSGSCATTQSTVARSPS